MTRMLKDGWRRFKRGMPGRRFQERYHRRQKESRGRFGLGTLLSILGGIVVMLGGIILLFIPGPGLLVFFFGLGMLGSEFLPVARFLDWSEVRARTLLRWSRTRWRGSSKEAKLILVLLALTGTLTAGYGAYVLLI